MSTTRSTKFVRSFLLVTGLLVAGTALFNRIMDPYGAYGGCPSAAFQECRVAAGSRVAKAELVRHFTGTTAIVGSSRAEVGYDPESPAIPDGTACNLALSGTNFVEMAHVVDYVLKQPSIRRIILCFDFQQFDQTESVNFDFEISRFNPRLSAFDYHCNLLLSLDSTKAARKTLSAFQRGKIAEVTPFGHRRPGAMESITRELPEVSAMLLRGLLQEREVLAGVRQSNARLVELERIVKAVRAADVELIVVIQPVHATMLEVYHCAGLWGTHEQWVADVDRTISKASLGATPVWDFTGFGAYTTEPLLSADSSSKSNRWFWEASHCKAELGEQILRRIFDQPDGDPQFGRKLTPEILPQHFAALRAEHDAWTVAHRGEAQRVQQLAIDAGCTLEVEVASAPTDATER